MIDMSSHYIHFFLSLPAGYACRHPARRWCWYAFSPAMLTLAWSVRHYDSFLSLAFAPATPFRLRVRFFAAEDDACLPADSAAAQAGFSYSYFYTSDIRCHDELPPHHIVITPLFHCSSRYYIFFSTPADDIPPGSDPWQRGFPSSEPIHIKLIIS